VSVSLVLAGGIAGCVTVAGGRVVARGAGPVVDCSGFLILPGIIDLHGDAFERHLAPRRGALRSLGDGLRAVEQEMAVNGVTTGWLPQFWSWEGGMRGPDFARALCAALDDHDALGGAHADAARPERRANR